VASKATGTKAGRDFDKEQLSRSVLLVNMVVQQNNGQSDRTQLFAEYFAYWRRWMETKDRALSIRAWNIGFSGLLCTGLGFLLLEKCSIEMGARPIVQITSTVVCALIAGATFRGAALQRPAASPTVENGPQKRGLPASAGNIVSAMLLACIGYAGAVALKGGWATNAAVLAVCLHLIPWSRIPLCSAGFLVPWGILMLSAAATMVTWGTLLAPLSLVAGAWFLWMASLCAWMMLIFLRKQRLKVLQSAPATPPQEPA
jgi:hypothetical protein